jgi:hypothetical protein
MMELDPMNVVTGMMHNMDMDMVNMMTTATMTLEEKLQMFNPESVAKPSFYELEKPYGGTKHFMMAHGLRCEFCLFFALLCFAHSLSHLLRTEEMRGEERRGKEGNICFYFPFL